MFYRVQIHGQIIGNLIKNPQIKYEFFGIQCVETLERQYKPNIVYRTKDKFEYSIFLDQPTSTQILNAKNLIRQKMLFDLNQVIQNLNEIKNQLKNPIKFK